MKGGFRDSPLRLNKGLGTQDRWDEATIQERAEKLANLAALLWSVPALSDEVLNGYRSQLDKTTAYCIDNHPHLATGASMRPLFDALRKEVLALNPCAPEEFLKLYVAYKAETNFVDVVPQAKRLRLSLNMHFHELHDPKGLAKDVTNIGRWGNGDVEVPLNNLDELPYIMGLVRQAFEKQMGNGETES